MSAVNRARTAACECASLGIAQTSATPCLHTSVVLKRTVVGALAFVVLASACGAQRSGYGSVEDVAQALGCASPSNPDHNTDQGYTEMTCTFEGAPLAIFWMDGTSMSYSGEAWAKEELWAKRDPWNVECSSHEQCVKAQGIIGGEIPKTVKSHP